MNWWGWRRRESEHDGYLFVSDTLDDITRIIHTDDFWRIVDLPFLSARDKQVG
jgi:hypothetical protein